MNITLKIDSARSQGARGSKMRLIIPLYISHYLHLSKLLLILLIFSSRRENKKPNKNITFKIKTPCSRLLEALKCVLLYVLYKSHYFKSFKYCYTSYELIILFISKVRAAVCQITTLDFLFLQYLGSLITKDFM